MKIDKLIDRGASLADSKGRPKVYQGQTIIEVYQIMKKSDNNSLPVYLNNEFVGTIALTAITGHLIEVLNEAKQYCQTEIIAIRNSITNIQGLTSLIHETNTPEETKEIIQLANTCCNSAMAIMENLLIVEQD